MERARVDAENDNASEQTETGRDGNRLRTVDQDADILALLDAGKLEQAMTLLMRRHGKAVYRYCRSALGPQSAAVDDVHQQVFIEAHRDLSRFARRSTLKTWLFGIAHHRVLDARRAAGRHPMVSIDALASTSAPNPSVADRIDEDRLYRILILCLGELAENIRSAVLLRYQQDFSFEEMAGIAGEKAGTLEARVRRALPVLRECIELRAGGQL